VGHNGVGKTNVLDAIYHLSFGKSYFNPVAVQNIKHGEEFFMIEGLYDKLEKSEKIIVGLKRGQKKQIKRNGKTYEKLSDHIGLLPLVIISPADRDLIIEGSDTRRKFMDGVISQSDTNSPIFQERYLAISNGNETVNLTYKSDLRYDNLLHLLEQNINKDRALQYTSVGIHKDDLKFEIGSHPIKKFGSQGQQKSYLIALKLAQFDFIKSQSKLNPILLLDDIFDKLDEQRVAQIITLVDRDDFGQLFISDTHAERTETIVKQVHKTYQIFKL